MAYGLTFRLELEDGTPADPPTFRSAPGVSWKAGDTIATAKPTVRSSSPKRIFVPVPR
jgi:hypothetical protein